MNIVSKPSPNFRPGRGGLKPEAIVIHIMDGSEQGTDAWFANRASHVSAHYGVSKTGEVHQYVDEANTAFHAGVVVNPTWRLLRRDANPNVYTIGIEHEGKDGEALTADQAAASAQLIFEMAYSWDIPLDEDHIIPHHAIRESKTCPGAGVDISARIEAAKAIRDQAGANPSVSDNVT